MLLYNKEGEAICSCCGNFWNNHSVGGNCRHMALTPEEQDRLLRIYSKQRPVPKIQQLIFST